MDKMNSKFVVFLSIIKNEFLKLVYSRWKKKDRFYKAGYSILLMVPGDLPVFLKIALDNCLKQDQRYLYEAIIVPDKCSDAFLKYLDKIRDKYPFRIKVACPNFIERFIINTFNTASLIVWFQLMAGVNQCQTRYILWHDADLFISNPVFLKSQFLRIYKERLSCLGVSEAWDSWFKDNALSHVTATWELMMDIEWIRAFKPWQIRPHFGVINNKFHGFDMLYLAQCLTDSTKIRREGKFLEDFIHFNFVICTYRDYQNRKKVFIDSNFRILLIRILVDAYDDSGFIYDLPTFMEIISGTSHSDGRVSYPFQECHRNYLEFDLKMKSLLSSSFFNDEQKYMINQRILAFSCAFHFLRKES